MKKPVSALASLAAAAIALMIAPRVSAQIETFDTITNYNNTENYGFTSSQTTLSQTFTNVAELNNLTYEFVSGSGGDNQDQTIQAYLVDWNSTYAAPNNSLTVDTTPNATATDVVESPLLISSFVVPPTSGDSYGTWSSETYFGTSNTYSAYLQTLSINTVLDPTLTYAVVLIDTTAASGQGSGLELPGVQLATNNRGVDTPDNSFAGYGTGYTTSGGYTTISGLAATSSGAQISGPGGNLNADATYGFSQINLVPGNNVVPTPEPRTAAAILCALFVAGLVGRQMLLRRQEEQAAELSLFA